MWVQGGEELGPPPYAETVDVEGSSVVSEASPVDDEVDDKGAGEEGQGEGLFRSEDLGSSWNPALRPE